MEPQAILLSPSMEGKCRTFAESFAENLHILSNEPSLALYRLQEHVRKSLPTMVDAKIEMSKLQGELHYDIEHSIETVRQMQNAGPHLTRIHDFLRSCFFFKQQLDYEKNRQKSAIGRIDSQDSIVQELRKSKSLGILRGEGRDPESVASPSGPSLSAASTPVSEALDSTSRDSTSQARKREIDAEHETGGNSGNSSPSTGSADSNPASDTESQAISKNKK